MPHAPGCWGWQASTGPPAAEPRPGSATDLICYMHVLFRDRSPWMSNARWRTRCDAMARVEGASAAQQAAAGMGASHIAAWLQLVFFASSTRGGRHPIVLIPMRACHCLSGHRE